MNTNFDLCNLLMCVSYLGDCLEICESGTL